MIQPIPQAIVDRLVAAGLKNVSAWSGETKDLLQKPMNYPAFRVVYGGSDFKQSKNLPNPEIQDALHFIDVMVFFRSVKEDSTPVYELLDAIIQALNGFEFSQGKVIPKDVRLKYQDNSEFMYSVLFEIQGMNIAAWDGTEPLITNFVFNDDSESES